MPVMPVQETQLRVNMEGHVKMLVTLSSATAQPNGLGTSVKKVMLIQKRSLTYATHTTQLGLAPKRAARSNLR